MTDNIEQKLLSRIKAHAQPLRIMHICGTHERTIAKYGLRSVLPPEVELLSGPGCPVCVTPAGDIDLAVGIAESGAILVSFGDMLRVPGSSRSLFDAKARGADVRMVYSIDDAAAIARANPHRQVVFFGIGFETTAPSGAAAVMRGLPGNFSILTSYKLVPPAMDVIIRDINVDAFIAPGHVSAIIGMQPYRSFADLGYPIVISGFEVGDVLLGIAMIQQQMEAGMHVVENAYKRAVKDEGNATAREIMQKVFEAADSDWRGIGLIENSGLCLKPEFEQHDARKQFEDLYKEIRMNLPDLSDFNSRCMCADILTARAQPSQCPMFGKQCSPKKPLGPCMVSLEGTCYNWLKYMHPPGGKPDA